MTDLPPVTREWRRARRWSNAVVVCAALAVVANLYLLWTVLR